MGLQYNKKVRANENVPYYNRKKHIRIAKDAVERAKKNFCKMYSKKYNFFKKVLAMQRAIVYTKKAVT